MDSNPINEGLRSGRIETTEDVEGHKVARVDGPDTDDVEGHMPRIRISQTQEPSDEGDDVDGHGTMRGGLVEDDQDVQGPRATSKHIDGPNTDDVEGHGASEDDDTEGHVSRGKG